MNNEIIDRSNWQDQNKYAQGIVFGVLLWLHIETLDVLFSNLIRCVGITNIENPVLIYSLSQGGAVSLALIYGYILIRPVKSPQYLFFKNRIVFPLLSLIFWIGLHFFFDYFKYERLFSIDPIVDQNYHSIVLTTIPVKIVNYSLTIFEIATIFYILLKKTK